MTYGVRMFPAYQFSVATALLIVGPSGCHSSVRVSPEFVQEADRLVRVTTPEGAWIRDRGTPKPSTGGIVQEWQLSTKSAWNEYSDSVSQALGSTYQCNFKELQSLNCTRSLPGDYFSLDLRPDPAEAGLIVDVRFEARPD